MLRSRPRFIAIAILAVLGGWGTRTWILSVAAPGEVVPRFVPPNEKQQRRAIGSTAGLPPPLQRAFTATNQFEPIPAPGASDWLAKHFEAGQTYDQFRRESPNRPDKVRRKLYLQPLSEFSASTSPKLEQLKQFTEAFFAMPVELLPVVEITAEPITTRQRSRGRQLLTTDIMTWLQKRLPRDAYCILGITMYDLYPADDWNYVFGQASLRERVGVYSFARYDPGFFGDERGEGADRLMLERGCKVLAHETVHMFGVQHCVYFSCLMNGSNHLAEADSQPLHMCPVCLRKLHAAVGFDVATRYEHLQTFCEQAGFPDDAAWYKRRREYLESAK